MTDCHQARAGLHRYLDRALPPAGMHEVEAHLVGCDACRREYESLGAAVEAVRSAQSLYSPAPQSRETARLFIRARRRRMFARRFALAAALLICAAVGFIALRRGQPTPDPFAGFAADTHLRYSAGKLPLDVHDSQPQGVAAWLNQRLPLSLKLPDYPAEPHAAKKYSLLGARLTRYRDEDIAYLAYEMRGKPISLLIGSSARITPAGGQLYRAGGLAFYQTTHHGLSTITWIDKGFAYALVSDYRAVGAESCAICHGGENDRNKFAPLKAQL